MNANTATGFPGMLRSLRPRAGGAYIGVYIWVVQVMAWECSHISHQR